MASRTFAGLAAFTRFLDSDLVAAALAGEELAEAAAIVLQRNIKEMHGSNELADLAPTTQSERVRLGYSANEPLLRDGSLLRDHVERRAIPGLAAAGSSEPVAEYQEFGTPRGIPPRPVFLIGLEKSEAEVLALMNESVAAAAGFRAPLSASDTQ